MGVGRPRGGELALWSPTFSALNPEVGISLVLDVNKVKGLQTYFLLLARTQAPKMQIDLNAEAHFQQSHPGPPSTLGVGSHPSHFGLAPSSGPRGISGKTLRCSGPVRAFTTEISRVAGQGGYGGEGSRT